MATPVSAGGFRVSFFYSVTQRKKFGWSENFFHPGPDSATVLTAAGNLLNAYLTIHASGTTCDFLRISDLANFRLQKLITINRTVTGTSAGVLANYVNDAFLFSLLGSDGRRVKTWVRNVSDSAIGNGGQQTGSFADVTTMLTALQTNGFCLRGLPRPQSFLTVTAFDQTTGNVTIPAHGLTGPAKIRIKGIKTIYPRTFNRIFKVTVFDANTVTIASWTPVAPVTPLDLQNATAAVQYYVNTAVLGPPSGTTDGSYVLGVTAHKTGRPFNLAIGKAKGRRRPAPGVLVAS
jgi:hypothetical protein